MSRELKFRAWVEEGKWDYYVYEVQKRADMAEWFGQSTVHIEQYTGLKDKNGKEIYEGDIVDVSSVFVEPKTMVVEFSEMACGFEPFVNGCLDCYFPLGKDTIVIGNIHENPELLGGEE